MHAQASRTTQKIRRPIEMEAIASIEDPTLRFFLEGEAMEKEARRAEAARLARERAQGFAGAFGNDNGETLTVRDVRYEEPVVKRRGHGGAIAFAGLSSLAAIGVAAWMWMTPPVRPALWWLKGPAPGAALTEGKTETPAPKPPETSALAAAPMAAEPAVAPQPAPEPAETRAATGPIIEQMPSRPVAAAPEPAAERRRDRGEALRGYVWSPTAKAMVPSEGSSPASEPSVAPVEKAVASPPAEATANPDSVMAPASLSGPGIAAPSTGPAPDETARVPSTEPAPFEQAPAKVTAPIID